MKNKLFALLLTLSTMGVQAQSAMKDSVMADTMRGNGKIYVVIAIILTILSGLFLYVFSLDKKISKLEKND
jgi:hypothetical protein